MQNNKMQIYKDRLEVAELILKVLSDKISVYEAVSSFPKNTDDINIKCAFDALMHREADENLRKNTPQYKEVQDDYLMNFAFILKENKELPENIVSKYLKYHKDNLVSLNTNNFKNAFNKIKRMINL